VVKRRLFDPKKLGPIPMDQAQEEGTTYVKAPNGQGHTSTTPPVALIVNRSHMRPDYYYWHSCLSPTAWKRNSQHNDVESWRVGKPQHSTN
jgi:hypothetical protein